MKKTAVGEFLAPTLAFTAEDHLSIWKGGVALANVRMCPAAWRRFAVTILQEAERIEALDRERSAD